MSAPQDKKDDVDVDSFVAEVMGRQKKGRPVRRKLFFGRGGHGDDTGRMESANKDYLSKIAAPKGPAPAPARPVSTPAKTAAKDRTITIQISGLDVRGSIKRWAGRHRRLVRLLKRLAILAAILLIVLFAINRFKGDKKPQYEGEDITPSNVYVPKDLPEGYSVGSGSQELENGAVLYTVYTDKGYQISVTQQYRPSSLNMSMFNGAQSFDTRLGKAYIIEAIDRITGYILTDDSMLLFNTTGPISSVDMKKLMEAFQP